LESAQAALQKLIDEARVDARAFTFVSEGRAFREILFEKSNLAQCVFLGFEIPAENQEASWYENYNDILKGMPPTVLVSSVGEENILA